MKNLIEKLLRHFNAYKKNIDWLLTTILFLIFAIGSQLDGWSLFRFIMVIILFVILTIGAYVNGYIRNKFK